MEASTTVGLPTASRGNLRRIAATDLSHQNRTLELGLPEIPAVSTNVQTVHVDEK
jgi:hypothetical protein